MPETRRYLLHEQGPALWPAHKPLAEVLELEATTPAGIWSATYQGSPNPPGGTIFRREWWSGRNRYDATDPSIPFKSIGRWMSWDTANKDTDTSAYTVGVVGELMPNFTLLIREVYRSRVEFPELLHTIGRVAARYADGKTREIVLEDAASGTSAFQTLMSGADDEMRRVLQSFKPTTDKVTRANQAAVWARLGCVLLPEPSDAVPWLLDFEEEIFAAPNSVYMDQCDAFSQLILWTEHVLADGWKARGSPQPASAA